MYVWVFVLSWCFLCVGFKMIRWVSCGFVALGEISARGGFLGLVVCYLFVFVF